MTARPTDWSPLAGSDPTPGDPEEVAALANRYRDTALEIERQARVLRGLSRAEGWESEAGEVFAEEAGELAGKLAKVQGRYAKVNMQLRRWAPALREAQCEADAALRQAKEAEAQQRANAASVTDGVDEPTPEQEAAERRRKDALDGAGDALAAARRRLDSALDALDQTAGQVSDAIRDASDDDVKDGWWDHVKGFISDHAKIIKVIATIASYAALAIAAVAIIIGASVPLLVLGLVAGVAVLLKVALAAAGEGTWTDAAFEAFSAVTLGAGAVLTKGAKLGVALTRGAAARHAAANASNAVLRSNRVTLGAANWARRTRIPLGPLRRVAAGHVTRIGTQAERAGAVAAQAVRRTPLSPAALRSRVAHWDTALARYSADIAAMRRAFPMSPEVVRNAARTAELIRQARLVGLTGLTVDVTTKTIEITQAIKSLFTRESRPLR